MTHTAWTLPPSYARALLPLLGALAALWLGALGAERAEATPLYAARAGRTCDNCHTDPTGWPNPELALRKCNLSCGGCHMDPSGGGLRTVSGRFYGEATLPMALASHRGYKDWDRFPLGLNLDGERRSRAPELAWSHPLNGSDELAFDQGRYAGLNADPLLQLGVDSRLATWFTPESASFFPMQLDVHGAVRPVQHLTVAATGGVLAESRGFGATAERETLFALKDAWVMVHQLPYMGFARAGRFVPAFGTRLEDHTSFVRRDFELDLSSRFSRVTGVEIGAAPNYPWVQLSAFRPNPREGFAPGDPLNQRDPPELGVNGWGAAAQAGWRDLGWQLGASGMIRQRDLADGGNTRDLALHGAFNPAFWLDAAPITLLAEYSVGQRQRPLSGSTAWHTAAFAELDWLVVNGLNLRTKLDFTDADTELAHDAFYRLGVGLDLHPLPNLTLTAQLRFALSSTAGGGAEDEDEDEGESELDGIAFLRWWF